MSLIGIDIGNNNCKMAVREGGSMRLISTRMPENMVRDGEVTTPETMAVFLKEVRESERVKDRDCALVLNPSQAFFRHVTLPPMTVSELMLNLPYEFRDFINNDPENYVYDYAVDEIVRDEEGNIERMELFAAAVPKPLVESYGVMLKKAGFKLKMITPAPMAYTRLLLEHVKAVPEDADKDVVTLKAVEFKAALFGQRDVFLQAGIVIRAVIVRCDIDGNAFTAFNAQKFSGCLNDAAGGRRRRKTQQNHCVFCAVLFVFPHFVHTQSSLTGTRIPWLIMESSILLKLLR